MKKMNLSFSIRKLSHQQDVSYPQDQWWHRRQDYLEISIAFSSSTIRKSLRFLFQVLHYLARMNMQCQAQEHILKSMEIYKK